MGEEGQGEGEQENAQTHKGSHLRRNSDVVSGAGHYAQQLGEGVAP